MDALDTYVAELRKSKGERVPEFSSDDGRAEARALFFLRDPGHSGATKTNVVDRDNPDSTARNFRLANERAALPREVTLSWNAVPWPVPEDSTFSRELEHVISEGWLDNLLALLPKLSVVALLGNEAHQLTRYLYTKHSQLHVLHGPHPSWSGVSSPEGREWLNKTIEKVRYLVV